MASTIRATRAIVAIYCSFGKANAVINAPLNTHHVPMSQAVNPDSHHPTIPAMGLFGSVNFGFRNTYEANSVRIIPSTIFSIF